MTKSDNTPNRRTVLRLAGSGFAATSLAGCLSGGGNDSDSVYIGATLPTSGPFGAVGQNIKQAMELGVKHANQNGDAAGRDVEITFKDTQTDPQRGSQIAQSLIQNENVDMLAGSFSNSVALSITEIAARNDLIYVNLGGGNTTTGEECRPNMFVSATNAVQQSSGSLGYVLSEGLGDSVYAISSDYSWGQDHKTWDESVLAPENDAEFVGNSWTEVGQGDFSQPITDAQQSGADVIVFNQAAGDHIQSAQQANEFGLFENHVCVWPATGITEAGQIGQDVISKDNFYAGAVWYWERETPAATEFTEAYRSEYDELPYGFSACMYAGTRTALRAVGNAETVEMDPVRKELEGMELFPQLWGTGERFRACDHAATVPTLTVTGRDPSEVDGQNHFEVVNAPQNVEETQMRDCSETGCEL
ncbi:ABC transporter substrate-binding protein [Halorientalis sp.]|uniref:ABC transporter substrate-binding protein n=1 Tax=Halorientalis sp. TaxID=1931229 RepID=UPI002613853C|nr:ABC transporter substrate-binding protein [Halorientalis sp.]